MSEQWTNDERTMDERWTNDERTISEGKSASWRSRVCDEQKSVS